MLVAISRTSGKAVEGATPIKTKRYMYRNGHYIKDNPNGLKEMKKYCTNIEQMPNGNWRGIMREFVTIDVLEIPDIYEFAKELNEEVIISCYPEYVDNYPQVEIYDDYRE
jgi:hypothetical protein